MQSSSVGNRTACVPHPTSVFAGIATSHKIKGFLCLVRVKPLNIPDKVWKIQNYVTVETTKHNR